MRDFHMPGRSTAYGVNGMAATSHPAATLAALDVLRSGGNAVDAAIAASAVLCVVEPQSTGIGGDCFALYAPASGGVLALNGSGWTPAAATIDRMRELDVTDLGHGSPHGITVPGAIAAWGELLEKHGTRSLADLLQPAINHAMNGFVVTPRVAWDWARNRTTLERSEAGRRDYLPNGEAPKEGRLHRLTALGRTLKKLAEGGPRSFYEGPLAESMVASLNSWGGVHTLDDFAAYAPEWVEPIHTTYRGVRVYECPPNGQGIVALLMLNMLEGFDLSSLGPDSAERIHLEAETSRIGYDHRDRLLADPRLVDVPTARILDRRYARDLAKAIDPQRAMAELPRPLFEPHPDTVYLTVVDRDLNAISFINSTYDAFGSGLVCPETGVIFHCRGRGFRLDEAHPNALAPRKRPMHTIIPGMAFRDGQLWCSFGVMGGDYQPVGHAHFLTNLIDYGMDPQAALDSPRTLAYPGPIQVEKGIDGAVFERLSTMGHRVERVTAPHGGGQAILVDHRRGVLVGGSDPRKDGIALGY